MRFSPRFLNVFFALARRLPSSSRCGAFRCRVSFRHVSVRSLVARLALSLRRQTVFFFAIAPLRGPLRVRAFVRVRWPRTGRLRRCRIPR